ncbi:hypothetical protein AB0E55_07075 [Amycolatopsis keratiniphila]|uniref:hypothetical protein n=1 Tax=Amycolatopsis keratiniphila TaxID=129921 RepID=UPI0033E8EB57
MDAPPVGEVVEVVMNAVGYDADVATANGYEVRTRPDGIQYSVKRGTPAEVIPMDVVSGNCGRSWMWLDGIGGRSVRINTGFHVRDAVSTFSWTATLSDTGETTKHDFPGFYDADGYVDLNRIVGDLSVGYARATVYGFPFRNYAVLVDGTVCYSGGPSDDAYIT